MITKPIIISACRWVLLALLWSGSTQREGYEFLRELDIFREKKGAAEQSVADELWLREED